MTPEVAFNYFKMKGENALNELFELIYDNIKYFKQQYDRKLLIMGFCNLWKLLFQEESHNDFSLKIFQVMIYVMIVQEYDEQSKNFKSQISNQTEEQDMQVYKTIKEKMYPRGEDDDPEQDGFGGETEDEDEEIFASMISSSDPVIHTIRQLETIVKTEDEYVIFSQIFNSYKESNFVRLQWFCTEIDPAAKAALKIIIQSKRVMGGNQIAVPRKIIKVKKKKAKVELA